MHDDNMGKLKIVLPNRCTARNCKLRPDFHDTVLVCLIVRVKSKIN